MTSTGKLTHRTIEALFVGQRDCRKLLGHVVSVEAALPGPASARQDPQHSLLSVQQLDLEATLECILSIFSSYRVIIKYCVFRRF